MLTSIGKAAARRVVIATPSALSLAGRQTSLPLRPAIRSFSDSRWNRMAAASGDKPKAPRAKKASSTTTATKKKPAKKPAVKKAKKKVVKAKKPAVKKTPKKVLTPEEAEKAKLKLWRRMALLKEEPDVKANNRWNLYLAENLSLKGGQETFGEKIGQMKSEFHNLSEQQLERLEAQATANKEASRAERIAWIESHPVEDIYLANLARRRLARATGKRVAPIPDHRMPKHPGNAFTFYVRSRPGQIDQLTARERISKLAVDWGTLSVEEKRPFEESFRDASHKYSREFDPIWRNAKEREAQFKADAKKPAKIVSGA